MTFIRTTEDFSCEKCGKEVTGNGYTNHCPQCLWSKHVDISPGDRASPCGGLMEPQSVFVFKDAYRIFHTCRKCGFIRAQDASPDDDMDRLIELSSHPFRE